MKRSVLAVLIIALQATQVMLTAQATPTFDAISIKRNTSGSPGGRLMTNAGRVVAENVSVRQLIASGYGVRDTQIVIPGSLDWLTTDRFDLQATMPAGTPPAQVNQMMQALLTDRFKLAVRQETQNRPAYALSFIKPDVLGPSLKNAADPACASPSSGNVRCGGVTFSPGNLVGHSATWTQLVNALSGIPAVGRLVIDEGGTHGGTYDFELKWTPTNTAGGGLVDGPSIFTAIQEQLGLKLTAVDGPVPVVVVLAARKPEAN